MKLRYATALLGVLSATNGEVVSPKGFRLAATAAGAHEMKNSDKSVVIELGGIDTQELSKGIDATDLSDVIPPIPPQFSRRQHPSQTLSEVNDAKSQHPKEGGSLVFQVAGDGDHRGHEFVIGGFSKELKQALLAESKLAEKRQAARQTSPHDSSLVFQIDGVDKKGHHVVEEVVIGGLPEKLKETMLADSKLAEEREAKARRSPQESSLVFQVDGVDKKGHHVVEEVVIGGLPKKLKETLLADSKLAEEREAKTRHSPLEKALLGREGKSASEQTVFQREGLDRNGHLVQEEIVIESEGAPFPKSLENAFAQEASPASHEAMVLQIQGIDQAGHLTEEDIVMPMPANHHNAAKATDAAIVNLMQSMLGSNSRQHRRSKVSNSNARQAKLAARQKTDIAARNAMLTETLMQQNKQAAAVANSLSMQLSEIRATEKETARKIAHLDQAMIKSMEFDAALMSRMSEELGQKADIQSSVLKMLQHANPNLQQQTKKPAHQSNSLALPASPRGVTQMEKEKAIRMEVLNDLEKKQHQHEVDQKYNEEADRLVHALQAADAMKRDRFNENSSHSKPPPQPPMRAPPKNAFVSTGDTEKQTTHAKPKAQMVFVKDYNKEE